jgi:pSer/pThr/pTyr-binding forkhead associated (FHA) protein
LKHKVTVIGRGTDTDVRLTDHAVSRRHAEVRVANGSTMLNDLQSTNGTTVNGLAVTTTALADGDEIKLGETVLTYRAPSSAPMGGTGGTGGMAGGGSGRPLDRGPWS